MLRVYYYDRGPLPLPPGHRFPQEKYALLRDELLRQGVLQPEEMIPATQARRDELLTAHTLAYVDAVLTGRLDPRIERAIGLPWSPELAERSLISVGASIAAARDALRLGIAAHLGGGTHHALAGEGQGYCVFNDIAAAALTLLGEGAVRRVAVIDLDVHQGNGTAAILAGRPDQAFVFSMHGQKNFPFRKVPSTLDINLPDETGDEEYLRALETALPQVFAFQPELVFYQAGVDPLAEDRLGRLALTFDGLARRDRLVFRECRARGLPLALTMGGGYARPIELTVQAHVQTYRVLKEIYY